MNGSLPLRESPGAPTLEPASSRSPAPEGTPLPSPASPVKPLVLLALVLIGVGLVYLTPVRTFLHGAGFNELRDWIRGRGNWAPVVFVLVHAAAVALGVPRLLFAVLGGMLFGVAIGVVLSEVATLAGCLLTYGAGRWLGREFVLARLPARSRAAGALLEWIGRRGVLANVLLRAAPVGNCFAMNLLMSLSPISTRDFLLGTLLGTLPETVIYSLFGSAAVNHPVLRLAGAAVLLALLALAYLWWSKKIPHGQRESDCL